MNDGTTVCEKCGTAPSQPHTWDDDDCVLDHTDHHKRHVGLICARHYHWIDDTLKQILELYALMPDALQPATGATDRRPSGEVFAPAPGRLDVMALTDPRAATPLGLAGDDDIPDLPGTLHCWAMYAYDTRATDSDPPLDGTVTGSIAFLRRERHWIARQPEIDDYTAELAHLHRRLASAVGDSMWPKSIGRCPNCGARLFNTIGVDEVTCGRCGSSWTGVHLARLRLVLEQEAAG